MNTVKLINTKCHIEDFRSFYNEDVIAKNPISGKKVNFIGDSYIANNFEPIERSWQYKLCVKFGCLYRNYGINGNPLAAKTKEWGIPVVNRYKDMDKDTDIIVVIAGKNDYNLQFQINEFQDAMLELCDGLLSNYHNSKIVFFTPWKIAKSLNEDNKDMKLQEYCDCMINICNQKSIPVFDVTRYSDINMYDPEFRIEFSQTPNDFSHLNSKGHNRFLPQAEKFLLSCLEQK